jgi:hypothetical protein
LGVWYDLYDDGTDPENPERNYGLLDASGGEKPAVQAVRTLMTAARNRQYAGMIRDSPAGHAMDSMGQRMCCSFCGMIGREAASPICFGTSSAYSHS